VHAQHVSGRVGGDDAEGDRRAVFVHLSVQAKLHFGDAEGAEARGIALGEDAQGGGHVLVIHFHDGEDIEEDVVVPCGCRRIPHRVTHGHRQCVEGFHEHALR
jgi:hypothetical protein